MKSLSQICLLLACAIGTFAAVEESNAQPIVRRVDTAVKRGHCIYYGYVDAGNGMVDLTRFIHYDLAGRAWTMDCPLGTLFSTKAFHCACTTHYRVLPQYDRCLRISGDFQGITNLFTTTRRTSVDGTNEDTTVYVEGFDEMIFSVGSSCYYSNTNGFPYIPFFQCTSVARGDLDILLRFSITPAPNPNENTVFPLIVNDGVDNITDSANPSFRLAYVFRNRVSSMELKLRVGSIFMGVGSRETEVVLTCTINPISRPGGDLPWFVTDVTNTVRVVGNVGNVGSFRIVVLNGQADGLTGIPDGGYCSDTTANRPIRSRSSRGSGLIIAARNDSLGFGMVPPPYQACISNLEFTRDCGTVIP